MNFLLLCIQSTVCVLCVFVVKRLGIISFRNFDLADAKAWFPISFLLVTVIYTGSKSLVSRSVGAPSTSRRLTDVTAILDYPRIYHFQELDHHPHRACPLFNSSYSDDLVQGTGLRGGVMVWRPRNSVDVGLVHLYGMYY
jgi:hypothetical protein